MMEKEVLIKAMKISISKVLEGMFFLPLDFYDASDPEEIISSDWETIICSRLGFSGLFSGNFLFFAPEGLARTMTANFMGTDKSKISQDTITETVKEIINMIAGNTFSIYDDQAVFDLGIPEMVFPDNDMTGVSASNKDIFIAFTTLDNDRAGVRMNIHP